MTSDKGKKLGWLRSWPEIGRVVLLFVALEVAVYSIERVEWITPQPYLTLVLILSILASWRLAVSRIPGCLSHTVVLFLGAVVTLWQGIYLLPAGNRFEGLITALQSWWQAGGAAPDAVKITFGVFLILLTWIIGYISTWVLLRKGNAWIGLALGFIVVLVNLSNLPDSYYPFLVAYFLAGAMLVAWNHVSGRFAFSGAIRRLARLVLVYTGIALLCLVVLAGTLAWIVPVPRLPGLQTAVAVRTLWARDIEGSRLNVFASVPSKQPINTAANLDEINFGKVWHKSDEINFIVNSPRPAYWRIQVYDTYGASGWSNAPVRDNMLNRDATWGDGDVSANDTMTYTVNTEIRTDFLLMAGDFIASDTPVLVHAGGEDVVSITIPRVLTPGERYSVTSNYVSPSTNELAAVGDGYPQDIAASYLQLPPDFSEDVRRVARRITRRAETPYEKVQAIDNYLSRLPYSTEVDQPPEGADGVEHFLFTEEAGFCLYFASAMAVMLRSVDVPARLAVGYLPGDPGANTGEYILRDKHYHAWAQVYFPDYGWVDLEATPSGSTAAESQVSVETPWLTGDTIDQLEFWEAWLMGPPYGLFPPTSGSSVDPPSASSQVISMQLPFAATLGRVLLLLIAGTILVFVALTPFVALRRSFSRWLWHVDRANLAAAAYAKMTALANMVNLGPKPQQTPLEFAAELGSTFPQEAGDVDRIARLYADTRFGGRRVELGLFEEAEILKARCRVFSRLQQRLGTLGTLLGSWRVFREGRS